MTAISSKESSAANKAVTAFAYTVISVLHRPVESAPKRLKARPGIPPRQPPRHPQVLGHWYPPISGPLTV